MFKYFMLVFLTTASMLIGAIMMRKHIVETQEIYSTDDGYQVIVDGNIYDLSEEITLDKNRHYLYTKISVILISCLHNYLECYY